MQIESQHKIFFLTKTSLSEFYPRFGLVKGYTLPLNQSRLLIQVLGANKRPTEWQCKTLDTIFNEKSVRKCFFDQSVSL